MTKNNLSYLIILTLLAGMSFACSDFLDEEPGSQTSITEQLSSKKGVIEALNGAYASIEANVRGERFAVYADLQGGNITFTPTLSGNSQGKITTPINIEHLYDFQDEALNSDFASFYADSYDIINQANLILEYVKLLTDASDEEKNQITAEALTMRAYAHYLLTLIYAQNFNFTPDASHLGIIYNTVTLTDGITYPARKTVKETYELIVRDLLNALSKYTGKQLQEGPNYSYFNTINTKAVLARVYLSQNNWQKAFDTATEVLQTSNITLTSTSNYVSDWEKQDSAISESLLEFSLPKDPEGIAGGSMSAYYGYTSVSDYRKYVASPNLIALFEANDIRHQLFLERNLLTRISEDLQNAPYYFTKKFQGNTGYVAMRLSELYFIKAEAALRMGQTEITKENINIIKARANANLLITTENIEEELIEEKRREFAFEGHLFFDLARNQKSILRSNGCISQNCNLDYPSPKYVLPISQANINLNSNLQQNESY